MSDQTKKKSHADYTAVRWRLYVGDDDYPNEEPDIICLCVEPFPSNAIAFPFYRSAVHEKSGRRNKDKINKAFRHIVAIHNAILEAGIDWRALERAPKALKTMIRLYVSAINQIEGHVSVELDRDLLKALGVKP